MSRRRYAALGVGALFIWWGIQGGLMIEAIGALWTATFAGGFVAALGHATDGFDGAVEALLSLALVVFLGTFGLFGWALATYGLDTVWLVDDAVGVLSVAVVVRHQFILPVLLGGASGGYANGRYFAR